MVYLAEEMTLGHVGADGHNIGSTWHGPSEQVIAVGELTLLATKYMIAVEFAHQPCWRFPASLDEDFKDKECFGTPYWVFYPGVALLFGSELAVNHLWSLSSRQRTSKSFSDANPVSGVDCHTALKYKTCEAAHLHTFHSEDRFSKYLFAIGKFDSVDVTTLDVSMIPDYALYLAMRGNKRTTVYIPPPVC
eukprot:m.308916 g.308916  ORF g.308916 m.308916 type:complete len:191 (+) comp55333_c0_seq5:1902-2474(+)